MDIEMIIRRAIFKMLKQHPKISPFMLLELVVLVRDSMNLVEALPNDQRDIVLETLVSIYMGQASNGTADGMLRLRNGTIKLDGVDYEFNLGEDK